MKKFLIAGSLIIIFSLTASATVYGFALPSKEQLSGKIKQTTLSVKGAGNPVSVKIYVETGVLSSLRASLDPVCNKKNPPDCIFVIDFAQIPNCKALGICKDRGLLALKHIKKRKPFTANVSYRAKDSAGRINKRFTCKKSKKANVWCKLKKVSLTIP